MRGEEIILLSLAVLSQTSKKQEEKEVNTREDYELIFSPNNLTATVDFHAFEWPFPDRKKRYLRAATLRNSQRIIDVNLFISDKTNISYTNDIHLKASPTHHLVHLFASTVFTWVGDTPIMGKVKINTYGNEAGDQLIAGILYEEKKQ